MTWWQAPLPSEPLCQPSVGLIEHVPWLACWIFFKVALLGRQSGQVPTTLWVTCLLVAVFLQGTVMVLKGRCDRHKVIPLWELFGLPDDYITWDLLLLLFLNQVQCFMHDKLLWIYHIYISCIAITLGSQIWKFSRNELKRLFVFYEKAEHCLFWGRHPTCYSYLFSRLFCCFLFLSYQV